MLNATLKSLRKRGKENIKHKNPIEIADLRALKESRVLSTDNPLGLLRNVWFHVTMYWCRRGREGQRELRPDSFRFCEDADGKKYVEMTHDEATKNHQGGIQEYPTYEKEGRMYATSDSEDGYHSLQKYLQLLNPKCPALFQRPKQSTPQNGAPWYENKPLGVNTLGSMMKEISKAAKLSKTYTNHCVRASAITLWSEAGLASRHIMKISGHKSEQSLKHYNDRPSTAQLRNCSDIVSVALGHQNPIETPSHALQIPLTTASSVNSLNTPFGLHSIPNFFNTCSINKVKVTVNPSFSAMKADINM